MKTAKKAWSLLLALLTVFSVFAVCLPAASAEEAAPAAGENYITKVEFRLKSTGQVVTTCLFTDEITIEVTSTGTEDNIKFKQAQSSAIMDPVNVVTHDDGTRTYYFDFIFGWAGTRICHFYVNYVSMQDYAQNKTASIKVTYPAPQGKVLDITFEAPNSEGVYVPVETYYCDMPFDFVVKTTKDITMLYFTNEEAQIYGKSDPIPELSTSEYNFFRKEMRTNRPATPSYRSFYVIGMGADGYVDHGRGNILFDVP